MFLINFNKFFLIKSFKYKKNQKSKFVTSRDPAQPSYFCCAKCDFMKNSISLVIDYRNKHFLEV